MNSKSTSNAHPLRPRSEVENDSGLYSSSNEQCNNCSSVDFEAYFNTAADHDTIPSISVHDATMNETICPFCGLLMRAARQFTHPHRVIPNRASHPVAFYFERKCQTPVYSDSGTLIGGGVTMRVKLRPPPSPIDIGAETDFALCPIFTPADGSQYESSNQLILENQIDLGVCRKWLRDCESRHPEECTPRGSEDVQSSSGLRLVDILDNCIIPAPAECRYVALSYVWGQIETLSVRRDNFRELEVPGALSARMGGIPNTIKDAMQVVRHMGERFLWVDRFCIIQDSAHKGSQVESMGTIYGAAILTIVAADGVDANAGLKGIRPGSRMVQQATGKVKPNLTLALSTVSPGDPSGTIWASRGWTCQEQVLSKRLLVFTHGQVIWQCPSCHLCEDTAAIHKVDPPMLLHQVFFESRVLLQPPETTPTAIALDPLTRPRAFTKFAAIIHDYTKRNFTFQGDILQAFQGFGGILQQQFGSRFLAGLPEAYFDQALLWMPFHSQIRRTDADHTFPSWSWAGWIGQIRYDDPVDSSVEAVVPSIKWYLSDGLLGNSDNIEPINDIGIGTAEGSLGMKRSSNTFLWIPLFELLSGRAGYPPDIELPDRRQGIFLRFWTSATFLDVALRESPTVLEQYEASRDKPIKLHVLLPRSGQVVGYLVLNGRSPLQTDSNRHEFIIMSEAQVLGFNPVNWSCKYSEECFMYNVMLVEWDCDHKIAYRLGVGRVYKKAWTGSRPVIKMITLG